MTPAASAVVTSFGSFLLLADESCLAMYAAFWRQADSSERRRVVAGLVGGGKAVEWTVVLDGTFLVSFVVENSPPAEEPPPSAVSFTARLELPTGRLAIRSGDAHAAAIPALTLTPGLFHVRVDWFVDEEAIHYDIEAPEAYPAGEGPDGVVTLRAVTKDLSSG